jgi:hypothetical protein
MRFCKTIHALLIPCLFASLPAVAAEWSLRPQISFLSGYNDNINLTSAPHDSVLQMTVTPAVEFGLKKQNQGITGTAIYEVQRFFGGSGRESSRLLNRENYYLKTNAYHNTQRSTLRGILNFTSNSALDSELDQNNNVVNDRSTRRTLVIAPSWETMLNERNQLGLSYRLTSVGYPDASANSRLIEYDYHDLSTTLIRLLDQRNSITLSAGYSSYQPDTGINSDTISLQAGVSRNFTETLAASLLAGARRTTSDRLVSTGFCIGALPGATYPDCIGGIASPPLVTSRDQIETTGSVFSASLTKTLETGSLVATLTRSSAPSGEGELLDTTRLELVGKRRFTETLDTSLTIRYSVRETLVNRTGNQTSSGDRNLTEIYPKLTWQWQREWALAGEYRYLKDERSGISEASRNSVYLSITYQPRRLSVSR